MQTALYSNKDLTIGKICALCGDNEDKVMRVAYKLGATETFESWWQAAAFIRDEFKTVDNGFALLKQIIAGMR